MYNISLIGIVTMNLSHVMNKSTKKLKKNRELVKKMKTWCIIKIIQKQMESSTMFWIG
jgi:hypothetical protein